MADEALIGFQDKERVLSKEERDKAYGRARRMMEVIKEKGGDKETKRNQAVVNQELASCFSQLIHDPEVEEERTQKAEIVVRYLRGDRSREVNNAYHGARAQAGLWVCLEETMENGEQVKPVFWVFAPAVQKGKRVSELEGIDIVVVDNNGHMFLVDVKSDRQAASVSVEGLVKTGLEIAPTLTVTREAIKLETREEYSSHKTNFLNMVESFILPYSCLILTVPTGEEFMDSNGRIKDGSIREAIVKSFYSPQVETKVW